MDRLRKAWKRSTEQSYEPIEDGAAEGEDGGGANATKLRRTFSYIDYSIFLLLGISMLWAWNMMLASGPYFQMRFRGNRWISDNFQAAEISVSTVTNLSSMLILTRLQAGASYPKRIIASLLINMLIFALLAASTKIEASANAYFAFLMVMIFGTSLATGLCQNGIFAFASGFGRSEYTQSIMTGQALAGVLPCVLQIAAVLSVHDDDEKHSHHPPDHPGPPPRAGPPVRPTSALAYFVTATGIAVAALFAFFVLLARQRHTPQPYTSATDEAPDGPEERKSIPLITLFRKLSWLATAVFVTFGVTMVFPVFTQQIVSVRPAHEQPRLLQPPSFVPLAFLLWNAGDLLGRLATALPGAMALSRRPRILLALALSRLAFVGLYHLCNIRGRGAVVPSDAFYLMVVQLLFGASNGFVGSTCMIGAGQWVDPDEREAAGGFMGLCLVAGLTVGSLLSFFVSGA